MLRACLDADAGSIMWGAVFTLPFSLHQKKCAGAQVIPKKGEDPEQDAREKALSRLATR